MTFNTPRTEIESNKTIEELDAYIRDLENTRKEHSGKPVAVVVREGVASQTTALETKDGEV